MGRHGPLFERINDVAPAEIEHGGQVAYTQHVGIQIQDAVKLVDVGQVEDVEPGAAGLFHRIVTVVDGKKQGKFDWILDEGPLKGRRRVDQDG